MQWDETKKLVEAPEPRVPKTNIPESPAARSDDA